MHAADVTERGHAQAHQIRALPQPVAVEELRGRLVLDGGVGAADVIAGGLERFKRFLHPAPLGRPARPRLVEAVGALQQVAADRRVERQLHLVDGDAVGLERQRLVDAVAPVLVGLAQHPGDEVDVDLREVERPRELVGAVHLGRAMRASVGGEDLVVEVFDAKAEPGHAEPADDAKLGLGQRARLALERDLRRVTPGRGRGQPVHQSFELAGRQKRRRAAAEVDKVDRPPGKDRQARVQLPLARQHVEIRAHFLGVLVGVHPEVAEVAALAAERDVQVHAERHTGPRRGLQGRQGVAFDRLGRPDRKRRVGRDKVAADVGRVVDDRTRGIRHGIFSLYPTMSAPTLARLGHGRAGLGVHARQRLT